MENHIHTFHFTGGSCGEPKEDKLNCDLDYKCRCGEKLQMFCTEKSYFNIPRHILCKDSPEPIEVNTPDFL